MTNELKNIQFVLQISKTSVIQNKYVSVHWGLRSSIRDWSTLRLWLGCMCRYWATLRLFYCFNSRGSGPLWSLKYQYGPYFENHGHPGRTVTRSCWVAGLFSDHWSWEQNFHADNWGQMFFFPLLTFPSVFFISLQWLMLLLCPCSLPAPGGRGWRWRNGLLAYCCRGLTSESRQALAVIGSQD